MKATNFKILKKSEIVKGVNERMSYDALVQFASKRINVSVFYEYGMNYYRSHGDKPFDRETATALKSAMISEGYNAMILKGFDGGYSIQCQFNKTN